MPSGRAPEARQTLEFILIFSASSAFSAPLLLNGEEFTAEAQRVAENAERNRTGSTATFGYASVVPLALYRLAMMVHRLHAGGSGNAAVSVVRLVFHPE